MAVSVNWVRFVSVLVIRAQPIWGLNEGRGFLETPVYHVLYTIHSIPYTIYTLPYGIRILEGPPALVFEGLWFSQSLP